MPGTPLEAFSDFFLATDEVLASGPEMLLNEATSHTYVLRDMLRGKGAAELFRGGTQLTERIQPDYSDSFQFYNPNQVFSPTVRQSLLKLTANWRYSMADYVLNEETLVLNEGDKRAQYKSLRKSIIQHCMIGILEGMEDSFWATPDASLMESASGGSTDPLVPLSIPAMISEDDVNWHASGFTTILGVDPATTPAWRNGIAHYDPASIESNLERIPNAMEDLFHDIGFKGPGVFQEYFKDTRMQKRKIYTSKTGSIYYSRAVRNANDRLVGNGLDFGYATDNIFFRGIPIERIDRLDDFYAGGAVTAPRYFFLDLEHIHPYFHIEKYFQRLGPKASAFQPTTMVFYYNTWYANFMNSRRRQGIVTPIATGGVNAAH